MMRQLSCGVAALGSCLLLPLTVHAARARQGDISDASLAGGAGTSVDAHFEADANEATDMDFKEAAELTRTLWAHTHVLGCMVSGLDPKGPLDWIANSWRTEDNEMKATIMAKVWLHELNQTMRNIRKNSLFDSVKDQILAITGQRARDKQALEEEDKVMGGWKVVLKYNYNYHYDDLKQKCILAAEAPFNRTRDMVEDELSSGCAGTCSRMSMLGGGGCQEASAAQFCPEGTQCGCHLQKGGILATAVSALAVAAYRMKQGLTDGREAALALPGTLEVGVLAAALSSIKAEGCRCLPSPCAWAPSKGACAPAPARNANNPFQAVMPYVGMKCVAEHSAWRAGLQLEPGCKLEACTYEDIQKAGQIGADTFNCLYYPTVQEGSATLFPPMEERMARYRRRYPILK